MLAGTTSSHACAFVYARSGYKAQDATARKDILCRECFPFDFAKALLKRVQFRAESLCSELGEVGFGNAWHRRAVDFVWLKHCPLI